MARATPLHQTLDSISTKCSLTLTADFGVLAPLDGSVMTSAVPQVMFSTLNAISCAPQEVEPTGEASNDGRVKRTHVTMNNVVLYNPLTFQRWHTSS